MEDQKDSLSSRALSVEEVIAGPLKLSRVTLYQLLKRGDIPSFTIGRRRFVTERAVSDYIARREREAFAEQWPQSNNALGRRTK